MSKINKVLALTLPVGTIVVLWLILFPRAVNKIYGSAGREEVPVSNPAQSASLNEPQDLVRQQIDFDPNSESPNIASWAQNVSLPPTEAPLKDVLEMLTQRSDRGDVRASCRLASDLSRCRMLPRFKVLLKGELDRAAKAPEGSSSEEEALNTMSRLQRSIEFGEHLCEGVDSKTTERAWEFLLRAANQGHVDSMLRFAIQPPLNEEAFLIDQEGWTAYRENAVPLLRRAAASGSILGVYHLFRLHLGGGMPGGIELEERDPAMAYAYGEILYRMSDEKGRARIGATLSRLAANVSATELSTARQRVEDISRAASIGISDSNAQLASAEFSEESDECMGVIAGEALR